MAIMLPDELIKVLGWLGLDWPDIDEDEVDNAADLVRRLADDLDALVTSMDSCVNDEIAQAMTGTKSGTAYIESWNANRANLRELAEFLPEVGTGLNVVSGIVVGLKVQFTIKLTTFLLQLVPLFALGPLGAGAAAARILAMKLVVGAMVDAVVSEAVAKINEMILPILADEIPNVFAKIVDFPMVEGTSVDSDDVQWDLDRLEQVSEKMDMYADDAEVLFTEFVTSVSNLNITGA